MPRRKPYWITERPSDANRWEGMEFGAVLDNDVYREQLFHVQRRYAKQWNDIELDHSRGLNEHTHEVCGAKVTNSWGKLILSAGDSQDNKWLVEVVSAGTFRQLYPGRSAGKNAMRSAADIKRILIHWTGGGKDAFDRWLQVEDQTKVVRGEWSEYKA